jgi:hypothetical protein
LDVKRGNSFAARPRHIAPLKESDAEPNAHVPIVGIDCDRTTVQRFGAIPLGCLFVRPAQLRHQLQIVRPNRDTALQRRDIGRRHAGAIDRICLRTRPFGELADKDKEHGKQHDG